MCGQPGMHKVCVSSITISLIVISDHLFFFFFGSNLTFGAGGKDKHGVVTAGWGYYEVILSFRCSLFFSFF